MNRLLPSCAPLALVLLAACGEDPSPPAPPLEVPAALRWVPPADLAPNQEVVLYCALDQIHSSPLIAEFQRRTGVRVRAEYDTEQNKTVGLVNRILTERENPRCDVFWNNEIAQTLRLANEGLLVPFDVPSKHSLPQSRVWRGADDLWCGFAARARVFIIHRGKMAEKGIAKADWPRDLEDLVDPRFRAMACISRPLTGTSATHGTALFSLLGEERARAFFDALFANEVAPMDSNGAVMRAVREGRFTFGLTDTDDYHLAKLGEFGKDVAITYPDGEAEGVLLIPNTVAKIRGGRNPATADVLLDFILSKEVEYRLARGEAAQIPARDDVPGPEGIEWDPAIRVREVDWPRVAEDLPRYEPWLRERFRR